MTIKKILYKIKLKSVKSEANVLNVNVQDDSKGFRQTSWYIQQMTVVGITGDAAFQPKTHIYLIVISSRRKNQRKIASVWNPSDFCLIKNIKLANITT